MSPASEADFQSALYEAIKDSFPHHVVLTKKNLLYVYVDSESGKLEPAKLGDYGLPIRKINAFQTDIMICGEKSPRVVLELKWNSGEPGGAGRGLNTDGILAYSAKAHRTRQAP